jgi:GH24 family phage-related lysozyme (muramidase)
MNVERLIKQLEKDVGKSNRLYQDTDGNKLIGIGHLITDDDPEALRDIRPGQKISESKCTELLTSDLTAVITDCVKIFGTEWESFPEEFQESFANILFSTDRNNISDLKDIIYNAVDRNWTQVVVALKETAVYQSNPQRIARMQSRLSIL